MHKPPWLLLFTLTASSCGGPLVNVTVPNERLYSIPDELSQGGIFADTEDSQTGAVSETALLQILEPSDGHDPGNPKHAPAVILPSEAFGAYNVAMEALCRDVGSHCTPEVRAQIERMKRLHAFFQARGRAP
jgi:hypothetical protein